MSLTDKEIRAIESAYRLIRAQKLEIDQLKDDVTELKERVESPTEMASWSSEEWKFFLRGVVLDILDEIELPVSEHNHLSKDQGGPAFASKGGLLQ